MFNVEGETAQTEHLHLLRSSDHSIASPAGWSSNSSGTPPRSNPKPSTSRTSKTLLRELPAHPRTTSPLPPQPVIPTTQCSASAPPPAPRLRSPFSATPLPAASTPASARRALRALPTTPSTARGPLSSSTLPTPLVSEIGGGEKALALEGEEEGLRERAEVWMERDRNLEQQEQEQGIHGTNGFPDNWRGAHVRTRCSIAHR